MLHQLSRLLRATASVLLMSGCGSRAGGYGSPEAAAFATYRRLVDSVDRVERPAVAVLYVNVPPDGRELGRSIERDLHPWARRVRLFRDTSFYASSIIPEDSLLAFGDVIDIRLLPASFVATELALNHAEERTLRLARAGTTYRVDHQWCRQWNCSAGAQVVVGREHGRYRGLGVLLVRIE